MKGNMYLASFSLIFVIKEDMDIQRSWKNTQIKKVLVLYGIVNMQLSAPKLMVPNAALFFYYLFNYTTYAFSFLRLAFVQEVAC